MPCSKALEFTHLWMQRENICFPGFWAIYTPSCFCCRPRRTLATLHGISIPFRMALWKADVLEDLFVGHRMTIYAALLHKVAASGANPVCTILGLLFFNAGEATGAGTMTGAGTGARAREGIEASTLLYSSFSCQMVLDQQIYLDNMSL